MSSSTRTQSTTTSASLTGRTRGRTRIAATAAAGAFLVNGLVALTGDVHDHTAGRGLVSEVTAGLGFLAGAVALALVVPVSGWRAMLWWLAPAGMALAGLVMLGVPVVGTEPAEWLFVLAVLPTFLGLVAAGVLGIGRRWPWWTGLGLAATLPLMFLLPPVANGFAMSLVWSAVALTAGRERREVTGYSAVT